MSWMEWEDWRTSLACNRNGQGVKNYTVQIIENGHMGMKINSGNTV